LILSFEGNPSTQEHEILSEKNCCPWAAYGKDHVILACIVLIQIKGVTDRQTDRPWLSRAKHNDSLLRTTDNRIW